MLKNNNNHLIPLDSCFQLLFLKIKTYSKRKNKIRICFIHSSCVRTIMPCPLLLQSPTEASGISRLHRFLACHVLTQPLPNNDFSYTQI